MEARRLMFGFAVAGMLLANGCSRSEGGRIRTIRESIDLCTFSRTGAMIFDSVPLEELRSVHLAGAGLINHDVLVRGRVETTGSGGTYVIMSDQSARMLVDTTRIGAANNNSAPKPGGSIYVHGEVKVSERGHIYLVANAIRGG